MSKPDVPSEAVPEMNHHVCESYEEFRFWMRKLEDAGYTYFGNTSYIGNDANCFTNADTFMGPVPHPVLQKYQVDPTDHLARLACFCQERGETIATTTGYNIFTGEPVKDSLGVFILTNVPTCNFKRGKSTLLVIATILERAETLLLVKIKRLVDSYRETFDESGSDPVASNIYLPFGNALQDKRRILEDLEKTLEATKPAGYAQREGKAEAIAQMHEAVDLLIKSIKHEAILNTGGVDPGKIVSQIMGPLLLSLTQLMEVM